MNFLITLILLAISEIFGDFNFKTFARTGTSSSFFRGSLGYIGVIYFLIRSLRMSNVLYVNAQWDGMSAIIESLAAYFILGERLNKPREYCGILVIILGIFMLHSTDGVIPYN